MISRLGLTSRRITNNAFARRILKPKTRTFKSKLELKNASRPPQPVKPASSVKAEPGKKMSLKELSKKYGWAAVGVYLALSAIDLPLCFVFVHSMGQERAQEIQTRILEYMGRHKKAEEESQEGVIGQKELHEKSQWGIFLTEFGIAYAIHKTVFIFLRIPATAAITPWAVKTLQRWGYNIGNTSAATSAISSVGKAALGKSPTKKQRFGFWFF